jgi:hypothetical protein
MGRFLLKSITITLPSIMFVHSEFELWEGTGGRPFNEFIKCEFDIYFRV